MKDQYSLNEVIKILECVQWLALSQKNRLMPIDKSFKINAHTIIIICTETITMLDTIDALIISSK